MLQVQAIFHWLLGGAVNIITIEAGMYFGENISKEASYSSPQRHEAEVEGFFVFFFSFWLRPNERTHTPSGRFTEKGVGLGTHTHTDAQNRKKKIKEKKIKNTALKSIPHSSNIRL